MACTTHQSNRVPIRQSAFSRSSTLTLTRCRASPPSASHAPCDFLIVDGTNVLCMAQSGAAAASRCAQPSTLHAGVSPSRAHADSFRAWLRFIHQAAAPGQAAIIVFDRSSAEGSSLGTSVRQQAIPAYLEKRHEKSDRRAGQVTQPRAPQTKRLQPFVAAAESLGFCVLWSEPGREADDMIGSLAAGLVGQRHRQPAADDSPSHPPLLLPPPHIIICSGDSDMQQLLSLSGTVAWMELLAWPGGSAKDSEHASAMTTEALGGMPWLAIRLHANVDAGPSAPGDGSGSAMAGISNSSGVSPSLARDQQQGGSGRKAAGRDEQKLGGSTISKAGLPPSAYPDYLALVGKPEAGVRGVGLSCAAAKTLLRRFGGVKGLQEAEHRGLVDGSSLRLVQQPAKSSSGKGDPTRSSGPQTLQRNEDKLARAVRNLQATRICCDPETVLWDRVSAAVEMTASLRDQTYPSCITQLLTKADAGGSTSPGSVLAVLHPHNLWHALSAAPYVEAVSALLTSRAVAHEMWRVTEAGLLTDLVIPRAQLPNQGGATTEACCVILLSPADFATPATAGFHDAARLAVHLRELIGSRSSPDHLPQKMKFCMTGIAQLRVKQLCREGDIGMVVVLPFYEAFHFDEHGSPTGVYDLNYEAVASLLGFGTST